MNRQLSLLGVALLFYGCTLSGEPFSTASVKEIQPNLTTKEQIKSRLGEPYRVGLASGFETWSYTYRALLTESGGYVDENLFIVFNKNGTVQKFAFDSNLRKGAKPTVPGSTR